MKRTLAHVVVAVGVMYVAFGTLMALVSRGSIPPGPPSQWLFSLAFLAPLTLAFLSWSWQDAPALGKSRAYAVVFTAAWFAIAFLAPVPYLFFTRGAKRGFLASLQYVCLLLVVALVPMLVLRGYDRLLFPHAA
jgi:hypothetical protein